MTRNRYLAVVVVTTVAVDWILKAVVQQRLDPRDPRPLVDGWLTLVRTVNHGVSWGALARTDTWWRFPLIVALTLIALAVTVSIVRASSDRWLRIGGALVLGGAVGNLGDRLVNGGVTDYVLVHAFPFVFNFADVAITCGGALLAARMVVEDRRARRPTSA
jgi:signal peptidase II